MADSPLPRSLRTFPGQEQKQQTEPGQQRRSGKGRPLAGPGGPPSCRQKELLEARVSVPGTLQGSPKGAWSEEGRQREGHRIVSAFKRQLALSM